MKLVNPFGFNANGYLKDLSLLLLRLTFGGLMIINHGWGKMIKLMNGEGFKNIIISPKISLALAVFAEVVCAGLIAIGLFTRLATIPLMITMFVAAFIVHWNDGLGRMEHALLFLIPYLVLFFLGPGRYSVDESIS